MAHIVEVIWMERFDGLGTPNDPCRLIPQLWTKAGKLVCELDPLNDTATIKLLALQELGQK